MAATAGARPGGLARKRRRWIDWGILVGVVGVVATLVTWWWPRSPLEPVRTPEPVRPAEYFLRVHVANPDGELVQEATVRAAAGEVLRLADGDGGWQIDIPAAGAPKDGWVKLWAESAEWGSTSTGVQLGSDAHPAVEIRLPAPSSRLRGRVTDAAGRGVAGVKVAPQDGPPVEAVTDGEGRYELTLALPANRRVGMQAQRGRGPVARTFCYAGRDGCDLNLEAP
jgi:hypothetical protein